MNDDKEINFIPSGRGKARCSPDPNYPKGKLIDMAQNSIGCAVNLPYPAPECGAYIIECKKCSTRIGVTTAGRTDDPVCVILKCKEVVKK